MIKKVFISSLVICSAAAIFSVNAQEPPTPEQIAVGNTETRQAVYKLLGLNMGAISGMAREAVEFDAAIAEQNARRIAVLATMIPEVFAGKDTRQFSVETEALPIIWDRFDEFQEKANNLIAAANTFADIAAAGDQMQTIGAVRAFGSACGNCHETFRLDTSN